MTYENDIFRKRPILGNRILVPIRDKPKPKRWDKIMSLWEAEKRCRNYKEVNEQSYFDPPTGCKSIEMSPNGTTKYWMWGCNCGEDIHIDEAVEMMKQFAFNW